MGGCPSFALVPDSFTPSPIQLGHVLMESEVDKHRRIYCRRYDECLDIATAGYWLSFSCQFCVVNDPETAVWQTWGEISHVCEDTQILQTVRARAQEVGLSPPHLAALARIKLPRLVDVLFGAEPTEAEIEQLADALRDQDE